MVYLLLAMTLCGRFETQKLVLDEPERSRVYVVAVLPDGTRTQIPVVNGYVPNLCVRNLADQIELTLDYRGRMPYDPAVYVKGIRYDRPAAKVEWRAAEGRRLAELPQEETSVGAPPPLLPEEPPSPMKMVPIRRQDDGMVPPSEIPDLPIRIKADPE